MSWSVAELAEACGGRVLAGGERRVQGASLDTRTIEPGQVFFAFEGEHVDGHRFVRAAAERGAGCAVVSDERCERPDGLALVLVDDAEDALEACARAWRERFAGRVVAIAGSAGKTTTKGLVHAVLSRELRGTVSPKSFNNRLGVSVTLLCARLDDDYLIAEIGTNAPGENEELSRLARPDVAVIVSLGREHLEGLGDLRGVAREEAGITAGLRGTLIVAHEPLLLEETEAHEPRVSFGLGGERALGGVSSGWSGSEFEVDGEAFGVPLLGAHNAHNGAAAVAVGRELGLASEAIRAGLAAAPVAPMRMEPVALGSGVRLIRDEYNAHPESVAAAIETVAGLDRGPGHGRRRLVALGDMLELGDASAELHREAGGRLAQALEPGRDLVLLFGAFADQTAGMLGDLEHAVFGLDDAAFDRAAAMVGAGDCVLVKASRGVRLERFSERLIGRFGDER